MELTIATHGKLMRKQSASIKIARSRIALFRSAPIRSAALRFAPFKSAPDRFALRRSASLVPSCYTFLNEDKMLFLCHDQYPYPLDFSTVKFGIILGGIKSSLVCI